jgi:hypothetical protein
MVLADLGMAAAGVLAVTFAWAGASKLARPQGTAAGFADLGLSRPAVLAGAVPVVELALAVALFAAPAAGGAVALVLLAGFSGVLVRALRRGAEVRCACFGRAGGPPLSWVELVRNGLLAALSVVALAAGLEPRVPPFIPTIAVVVVVTTSACLLALLGQRRSRLARVRGGG